MLDVTTGGRGNVAIGDLFGHVDVNPPTADAVCMSILTEDSVARFFVGSVANYCLERDDAGGDGETGGTGEDAEIARVRRAEPETR